MPLQLACRPFQILEGCYKVSPQPSLLQAEQPNNCNSLSLSSSERCSSPLMFFVAPLDPLKQVHVFTMLRGPEPSGKRSKKCPKWKISSILILRRKELMHRRAGTAWIWSIPMTAKIAIGSSCSLSGQDWERLRTESVRSALHKALGF